MPEIQRLDEVRGLDLVETRKERTQMVDGVGLAGSTLPYFYGSN
jgi:hypothetical protein